MSIESIIRDLIKQHSYVTVDQMMKLALSQNASSYYQKQKLLGVQGDFVTSPEISQLFGEMIGIWCVERWYELGCPNNTSIVELGPGRGLLMRDLLRVARLVPEFYKTINIQLIEINQNFKSCQEEHLSEFNLSKKWLKSINEINDHKSIIIANEFFDALPIKQYIKKQGLWHEVVLVVDQKSNQIIFDRIPIDSTLNALLTKNYSTADDGAIIEKSPQSVEIIKFIANHFRKYGGAALIIDYGYDIELSNRTINQFNSSLQAIKKHRYANLLENLGEADLSAHVDFNSLKIIALKEELEIYGTISQAKFLTDLGLILRASNLQNLLKEDEKHIIYRQVERLISPKQMGELFKVLILKKL